MMKFAVRETRNGMVAEYLGGEGGPIAGTTEFLELLMGSGAPTLALAHVHLPEGFLELRTGVAGEILQKVSNYRRRLVILGDFAEVESRALRDFIRESNATGQVVFAADLETGVALLK